MTHMHLRLIVLGMMVLLAIAGFALPGPAAGVIGNGGEPGGVLGPYGW